MKEIRVKLKGLSEKIGKSKYVKSKIKRIEKGTSQEIVLIIGEDKKGTENKRIEEKKIGKERKGKKEKN